jgi:2-polyprenyl-6-methoxyphenol hydroxylase-like FAD-dependent oxidoreductase
VTRRLVFGPEVAFAQRFGVYLAIFGLPNVLQLEDRAMLYNEPGRGCAYYTMAGNQRAKALFMVRSERPFEDVADEALQRQWLRDTFRDVGWQAPRLLAELDASSDIYCDEIAQIRMPAWSSGRVALLGDAAHGPSPLSGQGTTLALVGAYVLAEALKTHARPSLAFAAYERRMRPFVLENQRIAAAGKSFLVPGSTLAIHARNLAIRLIPLVTRLGVRIDARLQRASHAIELPSFVAS